jgi:hypothetical protein
MSIKSFKEFILEYELTHDVIPSHVHESDIDPDEHKKHELGNVDGHRVVHYKGKSGRSSYTFVTDKHGETVGSIEHKPTKTAKNGRLAISNITKTKGSQFAMGNVLHHLVSKGHSLESDNTNTEQGAHRMLMNFAKRPDINTHIENGHGETVPHHGDITSPENQKRYAVKSTDPHFLAPGDTTHKHILVFSKKT